MHHFAFHNRSTARAVGYKLLWAMLGVLLLALVAGTSIADAGGNGSARLTGSAWFAAEGECTDLDPSEYDGALKMNGDLQGCLYTTAGNASCEDGLYKETGTEIYIGSGNPGDNGTFETTYKFRALFEDCTLAVELWGRCHHPIVDGTGTGDFAGASGPLNIWDIIDEGVLLDLSYILDITYD